ncbi:MAG: phosphoribosylformylglycinamidine cyclo-ligase [Armatimonadetes bacterium]|nr:phosphoribosylformylglycinamidine cyclo-ligase [Armatimonadota bacterium]
MSSDETPPGLTYRGAGVDVGAKARLLEGLAPAITSTYTDAVGAGLGAFAGAVRLAPSGAGFLLATVDGVGTKTLIARQMGRDEVIGWDIVAHCANDLVSCGARPIAFLDYVAMGRLDAPLVAVLVEAMARACARLGVPLIGGETAEMPDVYAGDAYEVVGTMIGQAPQDGLLTGGEIVPGDRLVGLGSSGLHTNGYTLARRIVEAAGASLHDHLEDLGTSVGEALLAPHLCYAEGLLSLLGSVQIRAAAHITGGGLVDNLVRVLPDGCRARVLRDWPEPPIFRWLQQAGRVSEAEMVRTFNLGIGMVVATAAQDAARAMRHFEGTGIPAWQIGEILDGPRGVDLV